MSSGRYQSRVFNFLHGKTRKMAQQWEKTSRQLKEIAQVGVHLLLVPVYAVYQATRTVGKRLKGRPAAGVGAKTLGTGETRPATSAPPEAGSDAILAREGDTPIARVLMSVEAIAPEDSATDPGAIVKVREVHPIAKIRAVPQAISRWFDGKIAPFAARLWRGSTRGQLKIIGVASDLATRSLVLVGENYRILGILTPQQQQILRDRIDWELQGGDRPPLFGGTAPRPLGSKMATPAIQGSSRGIQPQWGSFLKGSSIVTRSPQIRPSEAIEAATAIAIGETLPLAGPLMKLDRAIARVEKTAVPAIAWVQDLAVALVSDPCESPQSPIAPGEPTATILRIQALIEAAIDYFFGSREPSLTGEIEEDDALERRSPRGTLAGDRAVPKPARTHRLPQPLSVDLGLFRQGQWVGETIAAAPKPTMAKVSASGERALKRVKAQVAKRDRAIASATAAIQAATTSPTIATASPSGQTPEFHPDWIEACVTQVEYVKHPLERVLEWVDRAMLYLEEKAIALWQWLQVQLDRYR
jgi:hypothetical protein